MSETPLPHPVDAFVEPPEDEPRIMISMPWKMLARKVAFTLYPPGPRAQNVYGLEITCAAPRPCLHPETCRHVRAALRLRHDAAQIESFFSAYGATIAPVLKVRIPLAPAVWARVGITRGTIKAAVSAHYGNVLLANNLKYEFDEQGIEDLKWQLINKAWKIYDSIALPPLCTACKFPYRAPINEKDHAWVVSWLGTQPPLASGRAEYMPWLCSDCICATSIERYMRRMSTPGIHPVDEDW